MGCTDISPNIDDFVESMRTVEEDLKSSHPEIWVKMGTKSMLIKLLKTNSDLYMKIWDILNLMSRCGSAEEMLMLAKLRRLNLADILFATGFYLQRPLRFNCKEEFEKMDVKPETVFRELATMLMKTGTPVLTYEQFLGE